VIRTAIALAVLVGTAHAGGGFGINIRQGKNISLVSSVGVLYEVTDFGGMVATPTLEDGTVADGIRDTVRWSIRIYGRYKIAAGRLGLIHDLIVMGTKHDDLAITFGVAYKAEWLPTKKPVEPP
jgi:hypothetical protein